MLPANFPGRTNARRRTALGRIEAQLMLGTKQGPDGQIELTDDDKKRLRTEAITLGIRIIPNDRARAIQTKKTKALGWSSARAARRSGKL